jgi:hypothetical protein
VALAGLAEPVALVVRVALAVQGELVVQVARVALAEPASPVALAELVSQAARVALVDRAVLAVLVVPVELELNREAELELDPEEAEPVHAQVVPPVKTRSVIAAHHRAQVPVPKRAEDLAVAEEETTREPAVTEAAAVWVAAE